MQLRRANATNFVLFLFALGVCVMASCGQDTLGRGFDATDSATRLKAIRDAASANDQTAIASLAHLLDDDDPAVRIASISALRKLTGADLGYSPVDPSPVRRAVGRRFIEEFAVRGDGAGGARPEAGRSPPVR